MVLDPRPALRVLRRLLNQTIGRDVAFRRQIGVPRLHLGTTYGGWTVQPELLRRDSTVYSVGIGDDISFDLAMINRFGCDVHAFDPTPKCLEWVRTQSLPPQFKFNPIGLATHDGEAAFVVPGPGKVSCRLADGTNEHVVQCPVRRLETLMRHAGHSRLDLLKMDIEGGEYAVLENLLQTQIRPKQLLVEFHHTLGDAPSLARTSHAIESLTANRYRIFHVSATGFEYSFIHG